MIRGIGISPSFIFKRYQSTGIGKNGIYVIALPITTKKSYIYCHHKPSLLSSTQARSFPLITKLENKATALVLKGWSKLSNSKISINVKVTNFVRKLLNSIHYEEACLRSFPSRKSMIREINEEALNNISDMTDKNNKLIQTQIDELNIPLNQIKPIPLFHPKFINTTNINNQLNAFKDDAYSNHLKYAIICGIGIPLSLPFALVPVVPNVPGFYIAYRFYCNVKALMGINHLKYLLDTKDESKHLIFEKAPKIDDIYKKHLSDKELYFEDIQEDERVIISNEIIEDLTEELNLPELTEDLKKAFRQETLRLNKNIKVDDLVQ
ncbi:hypothetical protein CLIB1444_02S05578 [[Candida] jaroonii]|uniref:Uncharacterized protein n=1 Tax=[Candida] jaroonii TaxID=467808 RepID=A0ACA9Y4K1_9ASCO|nr:hypothetical protein CLIB1444_02S05578 [[Candida] jaroonii]